jgi:hypothetical protein
MGLLVSICSFPKHWRDAMTISDNKALSLQAVSTAVKRLVGMKRSTCPRWTIELETILSRLPDKDLDRLEYLIMAFKTGITQEGIKFDMP